MVELVDYGGGNLGSVQRALQRLEAPFRLTSQPTGDHPVILPGVGSFGAVATALSKAGLDARLRQIIAQGTPFLGICVGLQVLLEGSEESPGVPGLGIIPGQVVRFRAPKVPQIGWNRVVSAEREGFVYFVNSYYALLKKPEHLWYSADYYGPFCAALRHQNVSAFQFHPEKSGDFGQRLLQDWLN